MHLNGCKVCFELDEPHENCFGRSRYFAQTPFYTTQSLSSANLEFSPFFAAPLIHMSWLGESRQCTYLISIQTSQLTANKMPSPLTSQISGSSFAFPSFPLTYIPSSIQPPNAPPPPFTMAVSFISPRHLPLFSSSFPSFPFFILKRV